MDWFPRAWRIGGSAYAGLTLVLAIYAFGVEHPAAFMMLLALTLPASFLLDGPIYVTVALADIVTGYGVGPSPWGMAVFVGGFVAAAVFNVVILRLIAVACSSCWQRLWAGAHR